MIEYLPAIGAALLTLSISVTILFSPLLAMAEK